MMVGDCRNASAWLCLLALDVDRLKSLNDTHGHLAGADAVRAVGRALAACVPDAAVACRYGGDEFVVALPRASRDEARGVANAIRERVHNTAVVLDGITFPPRTLSVSIGVAGHAFEGRRFPTMTASSERNSSAHPIARCIAPKRWGVIRSSSTEQPKCRGARGAAGARGARGAEVR